MASKITSVGGRTVFKRGFTIIEVLIVLAIASTITAIIFLGVPQLQANQRDNQRKHSIDLIYSAITDFYINNKRYPACDDGSPAHICGLSHRNDAERLLRIYIPEITDPSTGYSYHDSSPIVGPDSVRTNNNSLVYIFDATAVDHSQKPALGQIIIASGHWCYSTKPDGGSGDSTFAGLSPTGHNLLLGKFAIAVGTDKGEYVCRDNL